ncbi:MAG: GNAT family protein [Opitutaceae bacterium]
MTKSLLPLGQFETRHLRARKPRLSDAAIVFGAYATDPEVTRFLTWKPYKELLPLERFFHHTIQEWEKGKSFAYMLCLKEADEPIGSIHLRIEGFKAHFGYALAKAHWGKGLMTEALSFLVDWALAQPGIYRATAFCDTENPGSARVMEKAGMMFEGVTKRGHIAPTIGPEPRDCLVYAKVR